MKEKKKQKRAFNRQNRRKIKEKIRLLLFLPLLVLLQCVTASTRWVCVQSHFLLRRKLECSLRSLMDTHILTRTPAQSL